MERRKMGDRRIFTVTMIMMPDNEEKANKEDSNIFENKGLFQ